MEFCFGCSMCHEEAGSAKEKLKRVMPLLEAAPESAGYLSGIDALTDPVQKVEELIRRCKDCLLLHGPLMLDGGLISKRDMIGILGLVSTPAIAKELKIAGHFKTVAKARSVVEVKAALTTWRLKYSAEVAAAELKVRSAVFRQKFTLEDIMPVGSHACSLEALACV